MERSDDPDRPEPPPDARIGPPPSVVGEAHMRAAVHERLFGEARAGPAPSGEGDAGLKQTLQGPGLDGGAEPPDRIPAHIGRFEVLEAIGSGGMGLVLAARDPELNRNVAVKLLRGDRSDPEFSTAGRSRLIREAQAMAKLTHPNVITVHEVGTFEGGVFVAMELVDGQPLSHWIRERPHPWRDVVRIFRDAGRGLAAAHQANLVHRDFKPENVLLGRDGRVRVLDFGLARPAGGPLEAAATLDLAAEQDVGTAPLTRTGAVLGTPAYMSPEQYSGQPADARSDQFCFCVSLYEGLYGERPFAGKTITELASNVTTATVRRPRSDRIVPGWLRAAVLRGLAVDPSERWPNMDALLTAIDRDPARRWKRAGWVTALAGAAAAVALFAAPEHDPARACAKVASALQGVWDRNSRQMIMTSLTTDGPYARTTAGSTAALLDEYASTWTEIAHDACIAATGTSQEEATAVQACLDLYRTELSELVSALANEGPEMLPHAVQAAAALPDPTPCADPRRRPQIPTDPGQAERLQSERTKLARARIDARMSRHARAAEVASEVLAAAQELGHASTEAEALFLLGKSRERLGNAEAAELTLRDAVRRAEMAGDDLVRARIMTYLVYVIGRTRRRPAEAYALADQARDLLRAVGASPLLEANLLGNLAAVEGADGKLDRALEHHRQVLELRKKTLGEDHPDTLRAYQSVASVQSIAGHHDAAHTTLRDTIARAERVLGPDHPKVLSMIGNLANARARAGATDEAVELQRQALAGHERAWGTDAPRLAPALHNLGRALRLAGQAAEAHDILARGLAVREQAVGKDDVSLVPWLRELGAARAELGRHDEAVEAIARALLLKESAGATSVDLAATRFELAQRLRAAGQDPARATFLARSAREGFAARDEPERVAAVDRWLQAPKK